MRDGIIGLTFNKCPVVVADDGDTYAINEQSWDGEAYCQCWRVTRTSSGFWDWSETEQDVVLSPVERWQAERMSLDDIEENSPEWNYACERVEYEVRH